MVSDLDEDAPVCGMHGNFDDRLWRFLHGIDGIAHQIDDHLFKPYVISARKGGNNRLPYRDGIGLQLNVNKVESLVNGPVRRNHFGRPHAFLARERFEV